MTKEVKQKVLIGLRVAVMLLLWATAIVSCLNIEGKSPTTTGFLLFGLMMVSMVLAGVLSMGLVVDAWLALSSWAEKDDAKTE